ncbi:hypothetical protein D9M68_923800 [compost metagenome]
MAFPISVWILKLVLKFANEPLKLPFAAIVLGSSRLAGRDFLEMITNKSLLLSDSLLMFKSKYVLLMSGNPLTFPLMSTCVFFKPLICNWGIFKSFK